MNSRHKVGVFNPVGRVVFAYLVVALLWIVFSDQLLAVFAPSEEFLVRAQTYKGGAFVVLSSVVFWVLLRREWNLRAEKEEALQSQAEVAHSRAEAFRESEAKYVALLENTSDPVWAVDRDYRLTVANAAFRRAAGLVLRREVKVGDLMVDGNEDSLERKQVYDRALNGESFVHEIGGISPNGTPYCFDCSFGPIRSADGAIVGISCFGRDITRRRVEERREKKRGEILEAIVLGGPLDRVLAQVVEAVEAEDPSRIGSVLLLDESGKHLVTGAAPGLPQFFNDAANGVPIGENVGSCGTAAARRQRVIVEDIQTDPLWNDFRELAARASLRSCWSQPIFSADGSILGTFAIYRHQPHSPGEEEIRELEWAAQVASIVIQHRRAENALRTSEERFRLIWSQSTDGIRVTDAEGTVLMANPAFCQMVNLPRERLEGKPFAVIYPEEERASSLAEYRERMRARSLELHTQIESRLWNGKHVWFGLSNSYLERDNGPPYLLTMFRDITERKMAEKYRLRSQRLEAIGTLAGGIAHDLNNALAPIMMGAGLLRLERPEDSRILDTIETSIERGANMVRQLLTFAKGAEGQRCAIQAGKLLEEMENILERTFPRNIRLEVKCAPDIPVVLGDATQLHQVLLNLCVNARDAMPSGGTLRLEATRVELDETSARSLPQGKPGEYLALQVRDDGEGIPPEIQERIFDPFFTTKAPDKGTGLGLSTVMGILKGHGGFLKVYSQPGQGTTFTAYIPAAGRSEAASRAEDVKPVFLGQGEAVLFVDDEAAVREIAHAVLLRLNLTPIIAKDGYEALELANAHQDDLRVVVTDLHMPKMDGIAFMEQLRQVFPTLPCVISSGRLEGEAEERLRGLGVSARLDKPFTERQMAEVLKRALESALSGKKEKAGGGPTTRA